MDRSYSRAVVEGSGADRGDVLADGDFAREAGTVLEGAVSNRSREDDGGAARESRTGVEGTRAH